MKKFIALGIVLLLVGCGQKKNLTENFKAPENKKLVILTSHRPELSEPVIRAFEEETGIICDVRRGGTGELFKEHRDGKMRGDVLFGGGAGFYAEHMESFLVYESRNIKDIYPVYIPASRRYTPFNRLPLVLIYNSRLLSEEERPRRFEDFLDEAFIGKVAFARPETSATSRTILLSLSDMTGLTPKDSSRQFKKIISGYYASSSEGVIDDVAFGRRQVGITLEDLAFSRAKTCDELSVCWPEGGTTAVPDALAIFSDSENVENAEKFVDFVLSKDVQKFVEKSFGRRSVRKDLMRTETPFIEEKYIDLGKQNEVLATW